MKGFFSDLWEAYWSWTYDRHIMDSTPFVVLLTLFIAFVCLWIWGCTTSPLVSTITGWFWTIVGVLFVVGLLLLFIAKVWSETQKFRKEFRNAKAERLRNKDKQS